MSKTLKAKVLRGRYADQLVRITNVSLDELGKKRAAVILEDNTKANIMVDELEIISPEPPTPEIKRAKASMPFVSGSTGSRTMNQARSIQNPRLKPNEIKTNQDEEE